MDRVSKEHRLVIDRNSADFRLNTLYETHRSALAAYCQRRIASEAVADALSDIFLVAWRRIDEVPEGAELPWLYGVARNVVSNHQRGDRRRRRLGARLMGAATFAAEQAEAIVVRRTEERLVLQALGMLRPSDQELLRLRAWEELSSAEIGASLGISPSAVDMRLTRAKRRLRRALKTVGFFESPVSEPRIVRNGGPP